MGPLLGFGTHSNRFRMAKNIYRATRLLLLLLLSSFYTIFNFPYIQYLLLSIFLQYAFITSSQNYVNCVVVISEIVFCIVYFKILIIDWQIHRTSLLIVILDYVSLCISLHNQLIFYTTIGLRIPNMIGNKTDQHKLWILKPHV